MLVAVEAYSDAVKSGNIFRIWKAFSDLKAIKLRLREAKKWYKFFAMQVVLRTNDVETARTEAGIAFLNFVDAFLDYDYCKDCGGG